MSNIYLLSHSHRHGDDAYLIVSNCDRLDALDLMVLDPYTFKLTREDEDIVIEGVGDAVEAAILASPEAVSSLLRFDAATDEEREARLEEMDEFERQDFLDWNLIRDRQL